MRWIIIAIELGDNGKYHPQRYDTIGNARAFILSAAKSGRTVLGPFRVDKTPAEVAAESAMQACRSLDYAYAMGKKRGGSVDWADLDEAHVEAVKAVRRRSGQPKRHSQ